MKIKTSATERLDRRYLVVKAESFNDIEEAILRFSGALGISESSAVKVESFEKQQAGIFIIAINRSSLDMVRAACEISPKKIEILRVSGTIKGLKL